MIIDKAMIQRALTVTCPRCGAEPNQECKRNPILRRAEAEAGEPDISAMMHGPRLYAGTYGWPPKEYN
jgi:hypothetical protein